MVELLVLGSVEPFFPQGQRNSDSIWVMSSNQQLTILFANHWGFKLKSQSTGLLGCFSNTPGGPFRLLLPSTVEGR